MNSRPLRFSVEVLPALPPIPTPPPLPPTPVLLPPSEGCTVVLLLPADVLLLLLLLVVVEGGEIGSMPAPARDCGERLLESLKR